MVVTFTDLTLTEYNLTERLDSMKKIYFDAAPQVCAERPALITKYCLEHGLFAKERLSIAPT